MLFLESKITYIKALSKYLKLSSKENVSVTYCVFSEDLGYTLSISWAGISRERISGTPPAEAAVTHQMLTGSVSTPVTLYTCTPLYLRTKIPEH